jgi:signal transduction histidine kinase
LYTGVLCAQNNRVIDSLKNARIGASQNEKAEIFNKLGWEYRLSNPDSTLFYCHQALEVSKTIERHDLASTALNFMGIAYGYKAEFSNAFMMFTDAINYATDHQDSTNLAHAQNSLGRLLFSQGDMINSYEYFFSALNIFESLNDKAGLGYCYKSLSELYQAQNNLSKALMMSQKALDIRQTLANKRGQTSSYLEIANIHLQLKQYDTALEYLKVAQDIAIESKDNISLVETYLGISNILYYQGQFDEALNFGLRPLDPQLTIHNQSVLNQVHLQLGKIYLALKNYKKAELYLLRLLNENAEVSALVLIRDANFHLAKISELKNNNKAALKYLKAYNTVNDSLNNIDIARTIERMEVRLELQEIEKENKLLKAQRDVSEGEIERQKTRNFALIVTISLVIIIFFFIIRYTRQKIKHGHKLTIKNDHIEAQNAKINDQNMRLEKRNNELAELNSEKDTLMNIVAHDLKSPFNNLKGIAELIHLSGRLNTEQKQYVELMKEVATKGASLSRDILDVNAFESNDEPMVISKINLYDYVMQIFNEFTDSATQKNITIKVNSIDPQIHFQSEKSHLSRIIDNLLSNALKYSRSNTVVEIGAYKENGIASIYVQDQGPGFTEEDQKEMFKKFNKLSARPTQGESSNGLGLAIVKTLTDRLKGSISLDTSPAGSKFTVNFPDMD